MDELWVCPECGNRFVTPRMWHSCGQFSLDRLFSKSAPNVRDAYNAIESMVLTFGDVLVVPQKTRVAFQTRTRFAGGVPKRDWFDASFVFFRKLDHSRFHRIEDLGKWHVHWVRLLSACDVDDDVLVWLTEAKRYGDQVGPGRD